ncbi:MAG: tetratricopeptide repeat protein [Candidatus Kariarchaeaceae archaeon]
MENIEFHIKQGHHKEALQLLSTQGDLSIKNKILKARVLEMQCNETIFEAEKIIDDVISKIPGLDDPILEIEARSAKLMILLKFMNFPRILSEQRIFESRWEKLSDENKKALQSSNAHYLLVSNYVEAYTSIDIDKFRKGSQNLLNAVNIFLRNGDKYYATYALGFKNFLDTVSLEIDEINKNIEILDSNDLNLNDFEKMIYNWILSYKEIVNGNIINAMKLLEKTIDQSTAFPWIYVGVVYSFVHLQILAGKYNETIPLLENAVNLSEKLQIIHHIAYGKRWLADVYYSLGLLDDAKKLIEEALKINFQIKDNSCLSHTLFRASKIHYQLGNNAKAIQFSNEAYAIVAPKNISIIDLFTLIDGYYYKLILLLENKKTSQAIQFYNSLQNRYTPGQFKEMDYYMKLFEGLLLKYETRITKKVKAQSILESLIKKEMDDTFITKELQIFALFHYLELLLHEYNEYKETDVLMEIQSLLSKVIVYSDKHNLISFKLQFSIIETQLLVIQGKYVEADKLLNSLNITLEKQQNLILKKRVETQILKLNDTIMEWKNLSDETYTLREKIENVEILDYLTKMIKMKESD